MNFKKILLMSTLCLSMVYPSIAEAKEKVVNLKMSWWGGDDRHQKTLEALKLFEEKYPNIKVKPEYGGWQGWQEKVTTQIVGNTSPDVMQINWNWIDLFSRDGSGFYDLNKVSHILELEKNYPQEMLNQCVANGKLNAVPIGVTGKVFYINKTTYEKAGLPVPSSFEEMISSSKIIREKLGNDYYAFDTDAYGALLLMIYKLEQETGKPFIIDNKVAYTEAEVTEAVRFYDNLVKENVMPSLKVRAAAGFIPLDQHPSWIIGKFGGTYEWDSASLKWRDSLQDGEELVVGDYPTDLGPYNSGFTKVSMALAINKNTKYPKETAQLLNFLVSDEEAVKILDVSRGIPANKKAVATLEKANLLDPFMLEANNKVISFAGKGIHPLFEHKQLHTELKDLVDNLGYNQISSEEFAKKIIETTNNFLEANK